MKDYLDLFLNEDKSDGTKDNYKHTITTMLNAINKNVNEIHRLDLIEYKNTFSDLATATQANKIYCIKSYFKFLYDNEIIEKNPAESITTPKVENAPKDSLTVDEAIALMEHANPRERAIIAILLNTGVRVAEVINMQLEDFLKHPNEMFIVTKGNKFRKIIFNEDTINLINDYLKVRKSTDATNLFVSNQCTPLRPENLNSAWIKLAKKSGVNKKITTHTFRSTFITDITKTYGLVYAQQCVGHASISTTRIYVRGIDDEVQNIMKERRVC